MLNSCPQGFILEVLSSLELRPIIMFGASCRDAHDLAAKAADNLTRSVFSGFIPVQKCVADVGQMPFWACVRAASEPRVLFRKHCSRTLDCTSPLPFVLDSRGPWFVEFEIVVAKAMNGSTRIGLVDATNPLCSCPAQDLSQRREADRFAISLAPAYGQVYVRAPSRPQCERWHVEPDVCYTAYLNWDFIGDPSSKWNDPIQAGIFIENNQMTFFRGLPDGWHSSGLICDKLPAQVTPCMFMSSFDGFSSVKFVALQRSAPEVCPGCDHCGHGTQDGWHPWPSALASRVAPVPSLAQDC